MRSLQAHPEYFLPETATTRARHWHADIVGKWQRRLPLRGDWRKGFSQEQGTHLKVEGGRWDRVQLALDEAATSKERKTTMTIVRGKTCCSLMLFAFKATETTLLPSSSVSEELEDQYQEMCVLNIASDSTNTLHMPFHLLVNLHGCQVII